MSNRSALWLALALILRGTVAAAGLRTSEVPVAAPIAGVVSVGLACITNVVPVPVCAATAVAFPVLVIGPVRLALVVTWPAVKDEAVPVRPLPLPLKLVAVTAPPLVENPAPSKNDPAVTDDDAIK